MVCEFGGENVLCAKHAVRDHRPGEVQHGRGLFVRIALNEYQPCRLDQQGRSGVQNGEHPFGELPPFQVGVDRRRVDRRFFGELLDSLILSRLAARPIHHGRFHHVDEQRTDRLVFLGVRLLEIFEEADERLLRQIVGLVG